MKITEDIRKQIKKDFGSRSQGAIALIRKQSDQSLRVLRCVVFLSEGDTNLLAKLFDTANDDYRDVIFWAEYTSLEKDNPKQIRDFNKPFGRHELKKDYQHQNERLPSDVKRYMNRKQ